MRLYQKEKNVQGVILHSDQEFQYTSLEQYIDIVKDWLLFYNTIRLKSNKKYETTNYCSPI